MIAVVSFLVLLFSIAAYNDYCLNSAKSAYLASLKNLEESPTDPVQRKNALALGRQYARVHNKVYQNHIAEGDKEKIDETALMNDIGAACARASGQSVSLAEEIQKFVQLYKDGILTKEEFDSAKNRLTGVSASHIEDVVQLLRGLHQLKEQDVLSRSEFNMKKWDVLSRKIIQS